MANANTMCVAAIVEMMNATHAIGTPGASHTSGGAKDIIKAALYLSSATVNENTTAYASGGEVTGTNYASGGVTATNGNLPTNVAKVAFWTPSASLVYTNVTLSTAFNAVLLYNSSQANKAISVHTFGDQTVTAGTFTLTMPVNNESAGLIRMTVLP